jgi:hypothetical protein
MSHYRQLEFVRREAYTYYDPGYFASAEPLYCGAAPLLAAPGARAGQSFVLDMDER